MNVLRIYIYITNKKKGKQIYFTHTLLASEKAKNFALYIPKLEVTT